MNAIGRCLNRKMIPSALFFAIMAFGPAVASEASLETIQSKINEFLSRPGARSAEWGIEVIDPENRKVVVSVNPDKPFLPASVIKVVTTAAALEKLGPDFEFRTGVYTNGNLQPDGELGGDVILVGRGDPNLMDSSGDLLEKPALVELAERLESLGIRKICGDIVGDDSYFDPLPYGKGWTARDLRSSYGAPINALSINNNIARIYARPTEVDELVRFSIDPPTSYFSVRNLGTTADATAKRTLFARVIPGTRKLVLSGVLPAATRYGQYVILERPSEFTATLFRDELRRHGIALEGTVRVVHAHDVSPEERRKWTLLAEHVSPPLVRALEIINKHSENLHAEMLLRVLGAEVADEGTDDAGLDVIRDFLIEADIASDNISLNDGSGLSRDNLLTPRFQTALLLFLSTRPYFDLFLDTLAVSGTDGTLKHRLRQKPVRGVIHAKTGSLNGVATMSGYMTTQSGRNLIFSIFANSARSSTWRIRRTIDEICSLFVRQY